jgi:hypothetical protein
MLAKLGRDGEGLGGDMVSVIVRGHDQDARSGGVDHQFATLPDRGLAEFRSVSCDYDSHTLLSPVIKFIPVRIDPHTFYRNRSAVTDRNRQRSAAKKPRSDSGELDAIIKSAATPQTEET